MTIDALSAHTGVRLAEVGFLFMVFAGVWLAASAIPRLRIQGVRTIVAGLALAIGGVLVIIAIHWGQFASALP
jgi:uncharacterized membrane protein (DUF4010 family)